MPIKTEACSVWNVSEGPNLGAASGMMTVITDNGCESNNHRGEIMESEIAYVN
jgi:hypothetical protein